jgi:glycosyltransferase involved in cell wall biosynthesis
MPPLRVCFVAGTLGQGGAERQLIYMLRALKSTGTDLVVLTLTSGEFWEESIRALEIPVIWVGRKASRLARLWEIASAVREWKPQLIHSQHSYTNPYATATGRTLGIPAIAAVRNDFISEIRGDGAAARRWGYRHAKIVAANSKAALQTARSSGIPHGTLMLLPNVVDTAEFSCAQRPPRTPVHVLSVGRLVRQKRHDRFLRALAKLCEVSTTPFRATIVGAGPDRQALEALANSLDSLRGLVRFSDPHPRIAQCYREADILALTSDHEGTPNVVLEAMAAGLPVISTAVGDAKDIIQDEITGFVIAPEDPAALVSRLSELVNSAELRRQIGDRARQHIEEHYSISRLSNHLHSIYETALAQ